MSDSNAVGGLKWVKGEIVASLRNVRAGLEAVVEGGVEAAELAGAVAAINEVRGVLAALQLTGPARLVEEMQQVTEALAKESVANVQEAAEALMLALIQLPDYLGRLQAGQPDIPVLLLPAINDLRESRGQAPLREAELLVPGSVLAESEMPSPDAQRTMVQMARRVRRHFHRLLLQWYRGEDARQGLASLGQLLHQLQRSVREGIFHELFLTAEAVVEGLLDESIPTDAKTKGLIAHLDRILKPFVEDPAAWPETDAQALLVAMLAQIARSDSSSYLISELRTVYNLADEVSVAGVQPLAPPPEALAVLTEEVRKDLTPVRDTLDLFARGTRDNPQALLDLEPRVRRLATTLEVTGSADLLDRLRHCADTLGAMGRGTLPTDDRHLLVVAEELLAIEAALGELGGTRGTTEERALLAATMKEARLEMARAEQVIGYLADTPGAVSGLRELPDVFHRVAGALHILAESDAADVLKLVARHIGQRYLEVGVTPDRAELELLAQATSAIEFYMDGLSEGASYRPGLIAEARAAAERLAASPATRPAPIVEAEGQPPGPEAYVAPAQEPIGTPPAVSPTDRIDSEFLDIFLEEAQEEQQTIRDQFARWQRDASDDMALITLRRSFHTLKGSGRLVGAERVGHFAWAIESLLNRAIEQTVPVSPALVALIGEAVVRLSDLIAAEAANRPLDIDGLVARAQSFGVSAATPAPSKPELHGKVIPWPGTAPPLEATGSKVAAVDSAAAAELPEEADAEAAVEAATLAQADEELLDIFKAEAQKHLGVLRSFLAGAAAGGRAAIPDDAPMRALHTLTGSARVTGFGTIAEVTGALEQLFLAYRARDAALDGPSLALLAQAVDAVEARLGHLSGSGTEMKVLRALAQEARERAVPPVPEEAVPEAAVPRRRPPKRRSRKQRSPKRRPEAAIPEAATPEAAIPEAAIPEAAIPEAAIPEAAIPEAAIPEAAIPEAAIPLPLPAKGFEQFPEDAELLVLFLEDARDILDKLDRALRDLQLAPRSTAPLGELQRLLHTLKGSARLSGLTAIGDLSHACESLLAAIARGQARVDDDTLELAQRTLDTLSDQVDAVEGGAPPQRAEDIIHALALAVEKGPAHAAAEESDVAILAPSSVRPAPVRPAQAWVMPAIGPSVATEPTVAETAAPQIRVRADLLNRLVDSAGEISIYGLRLSRQSSRLGDRIGELDQTVDRLRGQLRQLEIETEAQILHRFERVTDTAGPPREAFDPLELERFSTLQQLSGSLAETVNDLVGLRTLLHELQDESAILLHQQARIADDLQDGLLRTRMVPFVQLVPRLHRLVRQSAQQLGKEARLEVFGPEVELDRSIQGRIVAPLEHLLRNAVAHGIEPPEQRLREGKPAAGLVSLALNREGNDVFIRIADDGRGLDLAAIRACAVELGLLDPAAEVSAEKIAQFILEPGFSTATQVDQIAGRGVGLDVVNAEIKQLSGSFDFDSLPGRGTEITIRLPLTLAILEALLVEVGEQVFAVPHATVEAAARIARQDLKDCYEDEGKGCGFPYAGNKYRVAYLGTMLHLPCTPAIDNRRWLPVLLARSGEQRAAFQVDKLLGSQRIVVKPLGHQLSSIRWLSGGTILPDGRVALILDLLALIRSGSAQGYRSRQTENAAAATQRRPCVMVVDDSLTVRRVTSRLLRRQNMDVITAHDGVQALTLLEERTPDVILLDIEMPRMDGYEFTRHVRRSPRLKDIPLIMITSRSGEKHRRYAAELGVDRYLSKPYQEADLLDEISSVLAEASL